MFREPSGAACNSFELWETDLDLAAGLGLNAYRFSVEWARVEPEPDHFDAGAIEHYEAIVDGCLDRGLAPVVTFNHFTAPHWFAARGGFIDDDAPTTFARYCGRVTEAFGDRISYAVTLNEPNLHRLLDWLGLPDFVRDLERVTLEGAARAAGVEHYRVGNVVLPEDYDGMQEGLTAAHRAAVQAIKDRRDDLPVGWSIAIVDDCAIGDDTSVRDAKRAELYDHYLDVAAEDDFIGVQNYERRWYDAEGEVVRDSDAPTNGMGSAVDPASLGGAVRYAYERSGVPVLVTEHGMHTSDDTPARRLHRAVARRSARRDRRRCARPRLPPLVVDGQLRVDLRVRASARADVGRPYDVRSDPQAERRRVRAHRPSRSHWEPDQAMSSWVGPAEGDPPPPGERPAYWLRREFELTGAPPGAAPGTLRLSARGLVEVFVNGRRVGDELLPGYMQYDRRLPMRTVDLTDELLSGANAIAVLLADGWFRGQTGAMRAADQFGSATSVWAELRGRRRGGRRHRRVLAERGIARHRRRSHRGSDRGSTPRRPSSAPRGLRRLGLVTGHRCCRAGRPARRVRGAAGATRAGAGPGVHRDGPAGRAGRRPRPEHQRMDAARPTSVRWARSSR